MMKVAVPQFAGISITLAEPSAKHSSAAPHVTNVILYGPDLTALPTDSLEILDHDRIGTHPAIREATDLLGKGQVKTLKDVAIIREKMIQGIQGLQLLDVRNRNPKPFATFESVKEQVLAILMNGKAGRIQPDLKSDENPAVSYVDFPA